MTFLEGFASGFNDSYNRRKDREAEKENTMFKYQMEGLLKNKELRQKKKLEETQWMNQAKDLSQQLGDLEAANTFYKELNNGVSYEALQKRIAEGQYVKNENYKQPTRTVKMPTGVAESAQTEATAPAMGNTTPATDPTGIRGIMEKGKAKREAAIQDRVNKQIDELDPELRQYAEDDSTTATSEDDGTSAYVFKDNSVRKIENLTDLQYQRLKAEQNKDPAQIREIDMKIKAHEMALSQEAYLKARAEGKTADRYFMVDEKNRVTTMATGEMRDGKLINTVTGEPIQGRVIKMTDDDMNRYDKVVDTVGKKTTLYNDGMSYFVAASDSAMQMEKILTENPDAATTVASVAGFYSKLKANTQAAFNLIDDKDKAIRDKISSGEVEGIEGEIKSLEQDILGFVNDPNNAAIDKLSLDQAKLRSLAILASYQYASATGVATGKLSNQDFQNNFEAIGADKPASEMLVNLRQVQRTALTRLDTARASIEKDVTLQKFQELYGVDVGMSPQRAYDFIDNLGYDPEQAAELKRYIGGADYKNKVGQEQAVKDAQATGPVRIMSVDDYNNLEPGTEYIDPNGKRRVKR